MCKITATLIIFVVLLCFTCPATCYAYTTGAYVYKDDFKTMSEVKEYQNLKPRLFNSETTVLSCQSINSYQEGYSGAVKYRLSGAEKITFGLYTSLGTSYYAQPESASYLFGYNENTALAYSRAYWGIDSKGVAGIFGNINGEYKRMYWDNSMYKLYDIANPQEKPVKVKYYGVNVYADGKYISFEKNLTEFNFNISRVYEEFSAEIPAGTNTITIELNDIGVIPHKPNGESYKNIVNTSALTFVEIYGQNIEPEPVIPDIEEIPSSSSASSQQESSKTSSKTSAKLVVKEELSLTVKPASSSQKESSSSQAKSQSSSTPKVKEKSATEVKSAEIAYSASESSAPEKIEEKPDASPPSSTIQKVYLTEKEPDNKNASYSLAVIYVFVAVAVIACVFIFGRK